LGCFEVGFFDEGLNLQGLDCRVASRLAMTRSLDVAIASFGFVRCHAQDNDVAFGGLGNGLLHCRGESSCVSHCLVGRCDDQHGVLPMLSGVQCGQCQCGCGVAACGLQQGRAQRNAGFTQLL
jgi:hypothetical protein